MVTLGTFGQLRTTRGRSLRAGAVLLAGATAGALAGCGGAGSAPASAPVKPSAPVEIEFWHTQADTGPTEQARKKALQVAERENPDYFRITFAEPGGANMTKVIAAVAAGTPPNLRIDYPYYAAQLWIKGAFVDVEQSLKALPAWQKAKPNLPPAFLEGARWLDSMVCIPFQISQQAMMYAVDKLEASGLKPPAATWTWNDLEELSKKAARPPDLWGMDVGWRSSGWQMFAGSNGTSWINKDRTKVQFTQPESVAGVDFLQRFTFGLGLMPPGADQKTAGELMGVGKTVFEPQGPYRVPIFRANGVTRLGAVTWPRGPQKPTTFNWGTLYSSFVFRSTDPAKERATVQAAVAALSDDAQMAHATTDLGMPVTKTGKDGAEYQKFLAGEPIVKQFVDMFPSCDVWPAIPSGDEMRQIMDRTMLEIYQQKTAPKAGMEAAERELQQIHDGYLAASKK
jgi:ABC-type glycerol-3-phosphate transport system substrate-binding protein